MKFFPQLFNLSMLLSFGILIAGCSGSKNLTTDYSGYTQLDTIDVIGSLSEIEYQATATRHFDLLHTKLEIKLNWEKQFVLGEAYLTLTPYFYDETQLVLDAKGFDIHKLGMLDGEKVKLLDFSYDSSQITIDLADTYTKSDTFDIYISYTAKPNHLVKSEPSLKDNKGLYFIDPLDEDPNRPQQIWTQGETESSSCWFPTIDKPNERCTQEVIVTVNSKFKSFSNGLLISQVANGDGSRTDHWKQELPHAPYLFVLVVGDYAVVDDSWRDIEVDYFVEPEYEEHAKDIFGHTPEMLEFYSNFFGVDFPWEKYHQVVVRDFVAGAMENTSATVHFEGLHKTKREMLDGDHEDIIAHEVAHQWFGDLVTCESWANIPLNEAFATYGEYIWFEHKYGQQEADLHLYYDLVNYMNESRSKQVPLIRFFYDHPDDMFDRHSYQKGGRVLHMLRKYVGEEAFKKSLQVYLQDNAYQPAEIHNLRLAFEKVTGEDLNWFFNQWFMKAGHPILDVNYVYEEGVARVEIEQSPSTESAGLFRLPVAIDIYTENGVERKDIVVKDRVTEVEIKSATKPLWINFDADKMLLCEKEETKPMSDWAYQYKNGPLMMDRYEAVIYASKNQSEPLAYEILSSALQDSFHKIREKAIYNIDVALEDKADIAEIIREIALNDPESKVRSEAIYKLIELDPPYVTESIEQALNDDSYLVISSGLDGLLDVDSIKALNYAEQYLEVETFDIQTVVAKVLSRIGTVDHYSFFSEKVAQPGGDYLQYNIIYYFGNYLSKMSYTEIQKGLPLLKEKAIGAEENRWIKMAGKESIERIEVAYERKKQDLQLELKQTDGRDLGKIAELEDRIQKSDSVLQMVGDVLDEIEMMN
ncbi:MAG: M1 family peptidase [Chitinophagales bacterium]|nr:M1 family peptidase [Chitinophagales bacterium]